MLTPGNVLYGKFLNTQTDSDYRYCIILHRDNNNPDECIVTTFTTGESRGGLNPQHGRNMILTGSSRHYAHVFKRGIIVGQDDNKQDFSFPEDSTVVPDYAMKSWTLTQLQRVPNIHLKCRLFKEEFGKMLHTLLKSEEVAEKYKPIIDSALRILYNPTNQ